jgi:hypothetical protein
MPLRRWRPAALRLSIFCLVVGFIPYLPAGSGVLSTVTVQPHEVLTPKL